MHAWFEPIVASYPFAGPVYESKAVEDAGKDILEHAVEAIRARHPDLAVERALVHGFAATALLREGEDADLLVVGSRGRGGFARLLLGSISQQIVHHSVADRLACAASQPGGRAARRPSRRPRRRGTHRGRGAG